MDTISAHGQLVQVAAHVNSVEADGITSLVKNSPQLLNLLICTCSCIFDECGNRLINLIKFKMNLKRRFPNRKLFTIIGEYKVVQNSQSNGVLV